MPDERFPGCRLDGSWRDVGGVSSLVAWYVSLTGDPDVNGVALSLATMTRVRRATLDGFK